MFIDRIKGNPLWEATMALAIIAASVGLAYLLLWLFKRVLTRVTARTNSTLDDHLFRAVQPSVVVFVVVQGVYIALTAVTFLNPWQGAINKGWSVLVTALLFWTLRKVVSGVVTWYTAEVASRTNIVWSQRALPIINRTAGILILSMGALVVLQVLGQPISPLLAGLGIGGLAVALAVQPTLSNFLSGTYVLSDGSIRPGDFIEIQGGPSGTVQGVGWRATRIVTPQNNLVIIPNSKLSDSIVTNFTQPSPSIALFVTCGVSYESDLQKVEQVALETMRELVQRLPEADKESPPWVLFREFGDSNITFLCGARAVNRGASFTLQHELVKALHTRFTREGIEINYPVRKLVFAGGQDGKTPAEVDRPGGATPQAPHVAMPDDDPGDGDAR
ncbi:MAG: mechanosensitive ion channel family protein [Chloroflexi bacterium]|nr:mechanosensitive ion channel family protein [Chloroflexota bacterium]